ILHSTESACAASAHARAVDNSSLTVEQRVTVAVEARHPVVVRRRTGVVDVRPESRRAVEAPRKHRMPSEIDGHPRASPILSIGPWRLILHAKDAQRTYRASPILSIGPWRGDRKTVGEGVRVAR